MRALAVYIGILARLMAFAPVTVAGEAGRLFRDETLRAEPVAGARRGLRLAEGDEVEIEERRAGWYRVRPAVGGAPGWVPVFSVTMPTRKASERVASARREFSLRYKTATMGVRGLDDVELREAQPDWDALAKLEAFAATSADLPGFRSTGEGTLRPVLVPAPRDSDGGTLAFEREEGRKIAAALLGAAPLVDDPEAQSYVNRVGLSIAAVSERPALGWKFGIVGTDSVNAFAVPGGWVLVTLGLYQRLESEAELAAALAHEIAHVAARHHLGLLIKQKALEEAAESAKKTRFKNPMVTAALRKMAAMGCAIFSAVLDRSAEHHADQLGMILAADAGYDPFAFVRVVQVLASSGARERATQLLRKTHPSPGERLVKLEAISEGHLAALGARPVLAERFALHDLKHIRMKREPAHRKP